MKHDGKMHLMMFFKKTVIINISLIFFAIVGFFVFLYLNYNNSIITNDIAMSLDRQRLLTQIMTKDADRISELNSELENYKNNSSASKTIMNMLSEVSADLGSARNEYAMHYEMIKDGYILINDRKAEFYGAMDRLNAVFNHHDTIFTRFNDKINIILQNNSSTDDILNAVSYIDGYNETLMADCNAVSDIVIDYKNQITGIYLIITTAIELTLILLILALFYNIYKELLLPVRQLYNGLTKRNLGILNIEMPKTNNRDLKYVFNEIGNTFTNLKNIIYIINHLKSNVPFYETLRFIFNAFSDFLPYTHIGVALIDKDRNTIRAAYAISAENHKNLVHRLTGYQTSISETSLQKVLESRAPRVINDLEDYLKNKKVKKYNQILLEEGIRSSITFPLIKNDVPIGIIFFSSDKKNVYNSDHVGFLNVLADSLMLSLEEEVLMDDIVVGSTLALATLTEERDADTGSHLSRMQKYSKLIAEILLKDKVYTDTVNIEFITAIERFSPLHDIGKVAIPDSILLKPGKLTADEFETMKTHTVYGASVLKLADENVKKYGRSVFSMGIEIAESHHEKWDGSGYPYGKAGQEIPLSARIVALADVFDALTTKRPYKNAFTFDIALNIVTESSGSHFDPVIIESFLKHIDSVKSLYRELSRQQDQTVKEITAV